MAMSSSGLFYLTFRDILKNTSATDLDTDTIKVALFTNSISASAFDTDTAYGAAPYNAAEVVNGNGYTTGGATLGSPALSVETGIKLTYVGSNTSWASASFTARGCLIYDDTIAAPTADPAICLVNFGADYTATNGTFQITWTAAASGGIFNIDLA
jgi:hypothetical protein